VKKQLNAEMAEKSSSGESGGGENVSGISGSAENRRENIAKISSGMALASGVSAAKHRRRKSAAYPAWRKSAAFSARRRWRRKLITFFTLAAAPSKRKHSSSGI